MAKVGFFEESEGVKSSTRLVFVPGTYYVLLLIGYMVYMKAGTPIELATFATMVIGTLAGLKKLGSPSKKKE